MEKKTTKRRAAVRRRKKGTGRHPRYVPLNAGERRALQELARLFEDVEIRIRAGLPCPPFRKWSARHG